MTDFLANFRTRRLLCQTLQSLSEREATAIEAGQYEELIDVLERKDRVVERLNEGREAIATWRIERDSLAAEDRAECDTLLNECELSLRSIQQQMQNATQRLTERRRATADLIQRVAAGQHTHQEYHSESTATSPQFRLDLTR